MADPSANVFNGKLYIYPSHDWDSGEAFDDDGGHFQMKDYHVLSIEGDPMKAPVTDHGVILDVNEVPWPRNRCGTTMWWRKTASIISSFRPRIITAYSTSEWLWPTVPKDLSARSQTLSGARTA